MDIFELVQLSCQAFALPLTCLPASSPRIV